MHMIQKLKESIWEEQCLQCCTPASCSDLHGGSCYSLLAKGLSIYSDWKLLYIFPDTHHHVKNSIPTFSIFSSMEGVVWWLRRRLEKNMG